MLLSTKKHSALHLHAKRSRREEEHEELGEEVDAAGAVHVGGGKCAVSGTDERLVDELAEVDVRSAELTTEDSGKCSLGPSAVGRRMLRTET